jgi:GNAT superfamily N-acetyltransferase
MKQATERRSTLRKAQWNDVEPVLALHKLVLSRLGHQEYTPTQMGALLQRMPTLDDHLIEGQTYFVHEVDGAIVSCGGWSAHTPRYATLLNQGAHEAGARTAYIRAMYTHPEWKRRGLGRQIIAAAEREIRAAGIRDVALDAMLTGVPLFRAVGYRETAPVRLELGGVDFPLVTMHEVVAPAAAGGGLQ